MLDGEFNSASNEYTLDILLVDLAPRKNEKYMKKHDDDIIITFFHVFLIFRGAGSIKSMLSGYSLDVELNSPSNGYSHSKFEKNHMEISSKYEF